MELTHDAITLMLKGAKDIRPVIQLFDIKQVAGKMPTPDRERFRCSASDGEFMHQAMFAVQLNILLKEEKIKNGSIVILTGYDIKDLQTRKIILILDLSVVKTEAEVMGKPLKPLPFELTVSQTGMQAQHAQNTFNAPNSNFQQPVAPNRGMVQTFTADRFGSTVTERISPNRNLGEVINVNNSDVKGPDFHSNLPSKKHPGNFSEPPAKFSKTGPISRNESAPRILPFKALSPYLGKWTIKGRVTSKSELKRYHNAKGEGKVFDFDLLDAEGGEIRVTCFNKEVDMFYDRIEMGQVYIISKGQLKAPQRTFNHLNSDWEITLDSSSQVDSCPDDVSILKQKFNFCPIADIEQMESNSIVDIIGIAMSIHPTTTIMRKNGTETLKRTCMIRDKSNRQIELTLWGSFCTKEGETIQSLCDNGKSPVVAVKGGRISEFNGKALGTISSTQLLINPDLSEASTLRRWFEVEGGKDQPSHSLSSDANPSFSRKDARKFIADIKDENIGKVGNAEYIVIFATISFIKHESFCYQACPLMRDGRQCNKKVIDMGNGQFRCEACGSDLQDCDYRYLLSLSVYDHTGVQWCIAFQEAGEELMSVPARDLYMLKEEEDPRFMDAFTSMRFTQRLLKLKVKEETWQDEQRVKCTVMKSEPVNYVAESKVLLDYIARMKRGESLSLPLDRTSGSGYGVGGFSVNEGSYGYNAPRGPAFGSTNLGDGFGSNGKVLMGGSDKAGGFVPGEGRGNAGNRKFMSSAAGSGFDSYGESRSMGGYASNPMSSPRSRLSYEGMGAGGRGRGGSGQAETGYGGGFQDARGGMGGGFVNTYSQVREGRDGGNVSGFSSGNRSNVCYNCGNEGHFANDCPSRGNKHARSYENNEDDARNEVGDRMRNVGGRGQGQGFTNPPFSRGGGSGGGNACFRCGMDGHFARDCPSFASNNGTNSGFGRQTSSGMY